MISGEWKTEWMKVRRRGIGWILAAFLGLALLWVFWSIRDMKEPEIWDGYRMLFVQFPLINTVLLPTMTAMLASRLWDAEIKGDTLKLLCTMEKKGSLYDMKFLMGAVYLALFLAAEIAMIFFLARLFGFGRPLEPLHLFFYVLEIYLPTLAVYLLQQILSFRYENQILPLAAGLFGSFVGLFCWFFPGSMLRLLFLWGYYALLGFINYSWDETTRIMSFYNVSFPVWILALLLAVIAVEYGVGKWLFLRKEI